MTQVISTEVDTAEKIKTALEKAHGMPAVEDVKASKTETDRLKEIKPAATVQTLADAIALAESGNLAVLGKVGTVEYSASTGIGGNAYQLIDGVTERPSSNVGSVFHISGGSGYLYLKGLFNNGIWLEQFGVSTSGDNAVKIKAATDYAQAVGAGDVYANGNVYQTSSLLLTQNVTIVGPDYNALNVHDMATTPADETGALVLQAVSGSTGLLIDADDTSKVAGIKNAIIDASNHTGDVVVFDGDDVEVRNNNYLKNVLIWKGTGKQLTMTALNNGSLIENVFCRGGASRDTAVSDYGIYDESQDSKIFNSYAAFCKLRCIYDAAGSGRRKDIDGWGSQTVGVEITNSARYRGLQIDGCGLGGLKIASAKNASILQLKLVNNNQAEASVDGDVEVTGDCRGTKIIGADFLGTDSGTQPDHAFYQPEGVTTGISVSHATIATAYPEQFNETAEAYWDLDNIKTTSFPYRLMRSNQINPNVSFAPHASNAPDGWAARNGATAEVELVEVPEGYHSATKITSSAISTNGIQFVGKTVDEVRNARVRIKGLVRGSGATGSGNQFLQLFDGVSSTVVEIPNNATWTEVALVHNIPDAATHFQVRLIASNTATAGLILYATAFIIEVY